MIPRWLGVIVALVAFGCGALIAAGWGAARHAAPPDPEVAACQQLASANQLSHANAGSCIRCEHTGGTYTYYMTGTIGWACDGGRG